MTYCKFCGKELPGGSVFCSQCGKRQETPPVVPQPSKTIGMGTYFGLLILFILPVIGVFASLIVALIAKNKNLKNFAYAALIWTLIATVIGIAVLGFSYWVLRDQLLPGSYWYDGPEHHEFFDERGDWEDYEDYFEERLRLEPYF